MKKYLVLFLSLLFFGSHFLTAQQNTFYFDFGPNDVNNGNITVNPDANAHYWNNLTESSASATQTSLIASSNAATPCYLQVTKSLLRNGIQNGGLLNPEAVLLADFAINTATQDYFFAENGTGEIKIGGLDPSYGYVFEMFGSRNTTEIRKVQYKLSGANTFTYTYQTSGPDLGGNGYNGNNSTTQESDIIYPNSLGEIVIEISNNVSSFGYLNAMKMEEYTNTSNPFIKVSSIEILGSDITTDEGTSPMAVKVLPVDASETVVIWSVDDPTIATITQDGLLSALKNGEIVVTATSIEGRSVVKGIKTINISGQLDTGEPVTTYYYFDFGPNDVTNGNITSNPDVNGNYWNNLTSSGVTNTPLPIITSTNVQANISWMMVSDMLTNGIQNGGLLNPDEALLGEFAINTATQDYFFTDNSGAFKLTGLDVNSTYKFSLFGSRYTNEVRIGEFTFSGSNKIIYEQQQSGTDLGGVGYNGNNSNVLVTDAIIPDADGCITIDVNKKVGSFCYVNFMKIEATTQTADVIATLQNAGFEESDLSGWTVVPGENTSSAIISENIVNSGDYALALSGADVAVSQTINYLANSTYYFTGKFYIPEANPLINNQSATLELICYDAESTVLMNAESKIITGEQVKNTWMNLWTKIEVPETTVFVQAIVRWVNPDNETSGSVIFDDFKLTSYLDPSICEVVDDLKISYMGSSVAWGTGATNDHGYLYNYTQILNNRFSTGEGFDWNTVNISIGGNSTVNVLDRWQRDLVPQCGSYVVYGLSLGNEGIHEGGEPIYNQFRDNLLQLISQARANGIEPVVVNCYARGDYNLTDYNYVKQMNLLIHQWDVASVNALGSNDNGSGNWVTGYWNDVYHPNDAGHDEFSYAMVPSLFDALANKKPQPEIVDGVSIKMGTSQSNKQIVYTPELILHPFTTSFMFKTVGTGNISVIADANSYGFLSIDNSGVLNYVSSTSQGVNGNVTVNDGQWHRVTLSHYYARGLTTMYIDGAMQGSVSEKLLVKKLYLSAIDAPSAIEYSNWFVYRSGMSDQEVGAINEGKMLKSSLEIYAPLDDSQEDPLANMAQSLNTLELQQSIATSNELILKSEDTLNVYPNPTDGIFEISYSINTDSDIQLRILDILGKSVYVNKSISSNNKMKLSAKEIGLISGIYFVQLENSKIQSVRKLLIK